MKTATPVLALAALFGACLGPSARADLTLSISNAVSSNLEFKGTGSSASFSFNNNTSGQGFKVTKSSNGTDSNTAVGLFGTIGGTFSYTKASIVTTGPVQTASITSTGTLTITDASSSHYSLTATVALTNVSTVSSFGAVNVNGDINLSNILYSGTNKDLLQLKNEAAGNGGVMTISFQFATATSLTQITASGFDKKISYSATIATKSISTTSIAPEPSSFGIAGIGALGMIGFGLRRRIAARVVSRAFSLTLIHALSSMPQRHPR